MFNLNKLARLRTTLVLNYNPASAVQCEGVKCRAIGVAKNRGLSLTSFETTKHFNFCTCCLNKLNNMMLVMVVMLVCLVGRLGDLLGKGTIRLLGGKGLAPFWG